MLKEVKKETPLLSFLREQGYSQIREVPNQGVCALSRFAFTTGLLVGCTRTQYKGRFCYPSFADAKSALASWDGVNLPPGNWIKYKGEDGEFANPHKQD